MTEVLVEKLRLNVLLLILALSSLVPLKRVPQICVRPGLSKAETIPRSTTEWKESGLDKFRTL